MTDFTVQIGDSGGSEYACRLFLVRLNVVFEPASGYSVPERYMRELRSPLPPKSWEPRLLDARPVS